MRKALQLAVLFFFAFSVMVNAQDRTISGTVTSGDDGSSLPGVSIQLKGTTTGVITDLDGAYSISVPSDGGILVFSFIGMQTQEVTIGNQTVIDVVLQSDVQVLSEIIVSGVAANTPREKLTVSVAKVDAEQLNVVPATSVSRSLSGKVSGVRISNTNGTPGGGSDILLRGDTNLGVGSSPMVIMDGIILEGGMADINPDDVESIEVVRGASASSLYGSRAGNGVIVITSKRGKGQKVGTTSISVRNEVGFQELERYIDLSESHAFTLASDWESVSGVYTKFDGVTYPAGYEGGFNPDIVGQRKLDDDHYFDNPYGVVRNHQAALFQQGMNTANFISVATRNEKSNMYVSYEHNTQEGIISNTDGYGRNSFRLNFDHKINEWLRFSASNMFISTTSNFPGGGGGIFFDIVLAEPDDNLSLEHPDGQPYFIRRNHWEGTAINPLYATWKNQRDDKTRRTLTNYKFSADATDWLSFDASYSMEIINYRYTSYNPKDTWQLNSAEGGDLGIAYSDGDLYKFSSERFSEVGNITANFDNKFGDLLVRGKLRYQYESNSYENFDAYGFDFQQIDTPDLDNIPDENKDASSSINRIESDNYYAIAALDYQDKILFDGLLRFDRSSLFGPEAQDNFYYRVSAAYRITEDVSIPGIQELKIRAARGTAGIRPGFTYQYETFVGGKPAQLGNKNLRPSNKAENEIALNARFLDKFTFEAMYSMQKTTDQFLNVPLLPTADGFRRQWQNAGTVDANTLEFNLGADIIQTSDLKWSANATFTQTNQTITELPIAPFQSGPSGLWYIKEGEIYGAIYGFGWVRTLDQMADQLAYMDEGATIDDYTINSDGYVIDAGSEGTVNEKAIYLLDDDGNRDFVQIGDGNPDFYMGIRNNISYKGITFYVLIDWKQGGDVYNRKGQWLTRDDRNGIMDMAGVPDQEKKTLEYYKQFYDVNTNNAYWVEDASYVKLREMAVGYNVPKSILEGFLNGAFKGADLKLIGRNLKTFTGYSGYDPEVGSIRNPFDGTGTYPNFRNYALSLSLKF